MEYSAVSQPPLTFCTCIQRGTASSMVAAQTTFVLPKATSTDPAAWGAMPGSKVTGRNPSAARPKDLSMGASQIARLPKARLKPPEWPRDRSS
jgi:hypothetical protein